MVLVMVITTIVVFLTCIARDVSGLKSEGVEMMMKTSSRTIVPFQYAWRFHYGDDGPPRSGPGTCAFEVDLRDRPLCDGMERNPNRFSEKDCQLACCYDPNCYVWQAYPISKGRACFHGYGPNVDCDRKVNGSGLGGGLRKEPPNPAFRTDYEFAKTDMDDDRWDIVDAPHDFIAEYGNFTNDISNFKQGYLPRNASWYRKHFVLPESWKSDGGATYIYFEGVFHHATMFLNGQYVMSHESGYTSFSVRIDNASSVHFGAATPNVLALRADASYGSGHWYEGGGIFRPVQLVHVPSAHVVFDGLFVTPEDDGSGVVRPSVEIEMTHVDRRATANVVVSLTLEDSNTNETLARNTSNVLLLRADEDETTIIDDVVLRPSRVLSAWSSHSPKLYRVRASLAATSSDNATTTVDEVEVLVGFRRTSWSSVSGFSLNDERVPLRGFSHHHSIGGLGVAIPERIWLFRVQSSRALGANTWRFSHNPYVPALYSLLDRAGIMSWDENRDYGAKYASGAYVMAMRDMVKRDRNHPSVIVWSFCNEYECTQNDANFSALAFRRAALSIDSTRPLTANDATFGDFDALDVQGFSHSNNATLDAFHAQRPYEATVLSECCSCMSQRPNRSFYCKAPQSTRGDGIAAENSPGLLNEYVSGSLGVWTLSDYFGEPAGTGDSSWPYVSSSFGQYDIAGFPKSHAYFYVGNWLQMPSANDPSRPPLPRRPVVRVLSLPNDIERTQTVVTFSTTPYGELFVDGRSVDPSVPSPKDEFGSFEDRTWTLSVGDARVRNVTFVGRSEPGGAILASHTVIAPGDRVASYRLLLSLDVPSEHSGTGSSLLLDGRDTAMIRASIVDASDPSKPLVSSATHRISFRVVSGPGMHAGVSNGDPASHEWLKSASVNAYMGLARSFVRVTEDCTSLHRDLAQHIDVDTNRSHVVVRNTCVDSSSIVVEATAEGISGDSVRLSIPVSSNVSRDSPFAIASDVRNQHGLRYLEDFIG